MLLSTKSDLAHLISQSIHQLGLSRGKTFTQPINWPHSRKPLPPGTHLTILSGKQNHPHTFSHRPYPAHPPLHSPHALIICPHCGIQISFSVQQFFECIALISMGNTFSITPSHLIVLSPESLSIANILIYLHHGGSLPLL